MVPLGIETTPLVAYDQGFMIMEVEPMDILKMTLKMSASNEVMSAQHEAMLAQHKIFYMSAQNYN